MFAAASFGFFGGGSGIVVPLAGGSAWSYSTISTSVSFQFNPDGSITRYVAGAPLGGGWWFKPAQSGLDGLYWVRATKLTGITPTGSALATWLPLSGGPAWQLSTVPNSLKECSLLIEISSASGGTPLLTSGTYDLYSESNNL